VSTTADAELPVAMQQRSAAQLSASWATALPTGHMPMLEDPTAVAEAIDAFSRSTR
jgi:pimeloyl-ACP methyl ester carboxylesterase